MPYPAFPSLCHSLFPPFLSGPSELHSPKAYLSHLLQEAFLDSSSVHNPPPSYMAARGVFVEQIFNNARLLLKLSLDSGEVCTSGMVTWLRGPAQASLAVPTPLAAVSSSPLPSALWPAQIAICSRIHLTFWGFLTFAWAVPPSGDTPPPLCLATTSSPSGLLP